MGIQEDTVNSTGPRLPWAGKRVEMEEIEETLTTFWHMSADNVRIAQNLNVRTSVLNFVICVPNATLAREASAVIRDLSSTHIARVILLILDSDPSSPDAVFTWVTLRSFPVISDITRHNFEQITMLASGSAVRAISNIIHPLLKPDLPVYTWWLQDIPTNPAVFSSLARFSNRIIIDSDGFSQPTESIRTLTRLIPTLPESAISDLNWGRITPWRQLVAQFFDGEYKHYLNSINTIEIEHAVHVQSDETSSSGDGKEPPAPRLNATRALLMAGWLKTSLNWQFSANQFPVEADIRTGTYHWQMALVGQSPARTTQSLSTGRTGKLKALTYGTIDIQPRVEPALPPGTLCLVRLSGSVDNKRAVFTINRGEDLDHVVTLVEIEDGTRPARTVSMNANPAISELLHDELEIMKRDHLYEQALQEIAELLS
jgi:hypothetical protein